MNTNLINKKTVALSVLLGVSSFAAHAVNLNVGATVPLDGTTASAEPQLAGTVLVDEEIPFSLNGITGHIQQRVVKSSKDGTIDFYWRVFNDKTSRGSIGSFRVGDFLAPEYNVNYRIDGLGNLPPDKAKRFDWDSVNFLFSDGLAPGKESNFFFFDTTATEYAKNAFFDLTGTGSGNISTSYPAYTPVYKPSHATDTPPTTTTTPPQNCPTATYDNGKLSIPVVVVSDPFGGSIPYSNINMKQTKNQPLTFEYLPN